MLQLLFLLPLALASADRISNGTVNVYQHTADTWSMSITHPSLDKLYNPPQWVLPQPAQKGIQAKLNDANTIMDGQRQLVKLKRAVIGEDHIITVTFEVPENANIYGFGEYSGPLRRNPDNTRQALYNRDIDTPEQQNLYGSHPFYMEVRNGTAHGVYLRNANPMDIILTPGELTYKVLGGHFDFYVFRGPTPELVLKQYTAVVGRAFMTPMWALGFNLCRWGYKSLAEVEDVVANMRKAAIPLETMWIDIDYMDGFRDFSLDPVNYPVSAYNAFVKDLHAHGQKVVLILDPGIKIDPGYPAYDEGIKRDIFIKTADGKLHAGDVWPGSTHFPDWFHPNATQYWTDMFREFIKIAPADGWWIDMNEVAQFLYPWDGTLGATDNLEFHEKDYTKNRYNFPAYSINNGNREVPITYKSMPLDCVHNDGTNTTIRELDVHNIYGHMEAIATKQALDTLAAEVGGKNPKRNFVLSRSTFSGTQKYAAHWTGDNHATWRDMQYSVAGILLHSVLGQPQVGPDVCGFDIDTTEELCGRWQALAAFYPFSRNHNALGMMPQEPYRWESVAKISRFWLGLRLRLIWFLYTLFYRAHVDGAAVARPLWWDHPEDSATLHVDRQFLLGTALLVSPVLAQGERHVDVYFPEGHVWYDFFTSKIISQNGGESVTVDAPMEHLPVHIRSGSIIPLTNGGMTTKESAESGLTLMIALDTKGEAQGEIYLDDGESEYIGNNFSSIQFKFANGTLESSGTFGFAFTEMKPRIDKINLMQHGDKFVSRSMNFTLREEGKYQIL